MRTQAATHPGAKVPLRSPRALYREHFADARRERLFLSSVAFFLTFAIVRALTYAIHAGRGPLHDVVVGGHAPAPPRAGHPPTARRRLPVARPGRHRSRSLP